MINFSKNNLKLELANQEYKYLSWRVENSSPIAYINI